MAIATSLQNMADSMTGLSGAGTSGLSSFTYSAALPVETAFVQN
jgi:hypothetical protein